MNIEEIKLQAAISALQGIMESGTIGEILELTPHVVVKQAIRIGTIFAEEFQKNKDSKTLEEEIKKIN